MILFVTIFYASYAFGILFLACEVGHQMSDAFENIWNTIDQFEWHLHPYELLRTLPTIMIIAQQPVDLEFFGSIACSRSSFKKVGIRLNIFDVFRVFALR